MEFLHDAPLCVVRLAQECVKGGDDGHLQFAHQRQHVTARRPAVNPKLVLNAHDVYIADVDEVRRALVGRKILLDDFETDYTRILITFLVVVERHGKTVALGVFRSHGSQQVGCERSDAAFAW